MRIIPVLDLAGGRAVHAKGGDRARYAPARSALAPDAPGDALAMARGARALLGHPELYAADLDAIGGRPPQRELARSLAAEGAALLLDAAIDDAAGAARALADGAARLVVGLETLPSLSELAEIVGAAGGGRVLLSLDLREGRPIGAPEAAGGAEPVAIAEAAAAAGVAGVIVLDLARVGSGRGLDLALVAAVRRALPARELIAGGGVRGEDDLARLADAGCDGALVATALHEGRLRGRA
jgi:phosphoribosylformimino-5-aminoimidazole carboxamide ribotide isomerase